MSHPTSGRAAVIFKCLNCHSDAAANEQPVCKRSNCLRRFKKLSKEKRDFYSSNYRKLRDNRKCGMKPTQVANIIDAMVKKFRSDVIDCNNKDYIDMLASLGVDVQAQLAANQMERMHLDGESDREDDYYSDGEDDD
jgi:hypothetical protein